MTYTITNNSNKNMSVVEDLIEQFYPYAQKELRFDKPISVFLESDSDNYKNPLGKTAFYEPDNGSITLYIDGRHPKDIMRSFSHELTHHAQNCAGHFDNSGPTEEGYAQTDPHLRKMEEDAYLRGNLVFRDWENSVNLQEKNKMTMNEETLRSVIRGALNQILEGDNKALIEKVKKEIAEKRRPADRLEGHPTGPDRVRLEEEDEGTELEEKKGSWHKGETHDDKEDELDVDDVMNLEEEEELDESPGNKRNPRPGRPSTDPSGKKPRGTIAEGPADEDPFSSKCGEGETWNATAQKCLPVGGEKEQTGVYGAPAEGLDRWYQGTIYERLLKEWTKK